MLPGQYYDAETGLHFNWNRYYDPDLGRYISADPIGLWGGVNLYAYVQNDPVNWIDPEGLIADVIVGGMSTEIVVGGAAGTTINAQANKRIAEALANGRDTVCLYNKIYHIILATAVNIILNESDKECDKEECIEEVSDHAKDRQDEAKQGDNDREVGDPNRVVNDGKKYTDSETGNTVYVKGNKVVITDGSGRQITQFKNPRRNTNSRIRSGRWIPK